LKTKKKRMSCTEGTYWPHYEVRFKEELNEREIAAEQLICKTLHDAGVEPLKLMYHARVRTCAEADELSTGLCGAPTKALFMRDCSDPPVFWFLLTVSSSRPDLTAFKKALKAKNKLRKTMLLKMKLLKKRFTQKLQKMKKYYLDNY